MSTTALLLAAGSGSRLGEAVPKAFVRLGGRPLLLYSLDAMTASRLVDDVVLVVPGSEVERAGDIVKDAGFAGIVAEVVAGGASRAESVRLGLEAVAPSTDVVVCHDAARPFASAALFARAIERIRDAEGVVPVVPSPDTVKRVERGAIVGTIPRNEVSLAQTPQVFRVDALMSSHHTQLPNTIGEATDDAMLLETAGFRVLAVEGEPSNFKITSRDDLRRAEILIAQMPTPSHRVDRSSDDIRRVP